MIEDIRYLIVFAKIAEVGSISGGAEALGITTATASLHLSKLEKNLCSALLYRNTRRISLTHDGAILLETAKSMLELYEKGFIEFKQRSTLIKKNLRISIPAVFINSGFTQHIAMFIKKYPDVRLSISCNDRCNDIIAESIDVAFRIGDLPDSSLKARHLFLLPRQVIASREYLAECEPVRSPRDLERMKWIGLTMRPNRRLFRHKKSGEEVEIKYTPNVCVDNVEASYQLARLKAGLAAPPNYLSDEGIRHNEVIAVIPEWTLEPLKVYAVWPPNVSIHSVAYTFIKTIHDSFNSHALR
jgi:DNA-binding transcriptional LysR family regulator